MNFLAVYGYRESNLVTKFFYAKKELCKMVGVEYFFCEFLVHIIFGGL